MRTLSEELLGAQSALNRRPVSSIIVRDVMLRFSDFTTSAYDTGYPSAEDDDGIPRAPVDSGHVTEYGNPLTGIFRVWTSADTVYVHRCVVPPVLADWQNTDTVATYTTDAIHRPGFRDGWVFYGYNGDIYHAYNLGAASVFRASAYSVGTANIALAPINTSTVYMLRLHTALGDFRYISIHRVTDSGIETCPHTIVVDPDYNGASLSWFDAESVGSRDVLVINERTYGHPVVVFYEGGVWSQPRPIMPMDIVDNYSFLRIAGLAAIEGASGDRVLWASGRLGRKGSTGAHPQEADVVLRSKDGEHWSFDRYAYLCQDNMRSRLIAYDDNYVYYAAGAVVKRAPRSWLAGGDAASKWTLDSDILSWTYSQPSPGAACKGNVSVADHNDEYGSSLRPGYWLWRYAGYNGHTVLLSTEGIDGMRRSYRAGDRQLTLHTRDIAMRLLTDWASSQDWQWLSQQKHLDDCDKVDYLYSVGAASIQVPDQQDAELTGTVEQDDLDEAENSDGLEFKTYNRPGIFFCTKPFDARMFRVTARFQFHHSGPTSGPTGLGHNLTVDSNQGTLSYTGGDTPYFTDDGQDFWEWAMVSDEEEAAYIIVVTNSDGTFTWAYLGLLVDGSDNHSVYVRKQPDGEAGWNGTDPTGKTPASYVISRSDDRARPGEGFGVVGCGVDQYNFVAAFMGLADEKLYLMFRRGEQGAAPWFILDEAALSATPERGKLYEVQLVRNGRALSARVVELGDDGAWVDLATVEHNWNWPTPMVATGWDDDDWDDRGKVGIICHLAVPETRIGSITRDKNFVMRDPDLFNRLYIDENGWAAHASNQDDYGDFQDGAAAPPLRFGGEVYNPAEASAPDEAPYTALKRTLSNRATLECRITHRDPDINQMCLKPDGYDHTATPENGWSGSEPFFWLSTDQLGIGSTATATQCQKATWTGDCCVVSDMDEDWWKIELDDHAKLVPGFYLPGRGNSEAAQAHGAGTVLRQHWEPYIRVRSIRAFDGEFDKSLEWVLLDIASKAGVLDFDTDRSIDETINPSDTTVHWLEDVDGETVRQRDFDLTITLPNKLNEGDAICVLARASDTPSAIPTTPSDFAGVLIEYYHYDATTWKVRIWQTSTASNSWRLIDSVNWSSKADGQRVRVVGREQAIAVYVNDCRLSSYAIGPLYGYDSDGYEDSLAGAGYIGIYRLSGTAPASLDGTTVTQPELWAWTDGVILDQRMNAVSGLRRAIQDRRIKFFGNADGSLRISLFEHRDAPLNVAVGSEQGALSYTTWSECDCSPNRAFQDTGQDFTRWRGAGSRARCKIVVTNDDSSESWGYIGYAKGDTACVFQDVEMSQSGWNGADPSGKTPVSYEVYLIAVGDQVYQDDTGPTDRVPTYVRVVGEEISEYIDHDSAAELGLVFASASCPSLEEEEAYKEAQRLVEDALSQARARQQTSAARLNWEVEDEVRVAFFPADGGNVVDGTYIVDAVGFQYRPGDLVMQAVLREKNPQWGPQIHY